MSDEALVAEGMFDVPGAKAHTCLSRSYLYALMDRGELRYVKCGKRRLIPRAEINRLMREGLVGASAAS
jgi:excisionase family DNA binding protein